MRAAAVVLLMLLGACAGQTPAPKPPPVAEPDLPDPDAAGEDRSGRRLRQPPSDAPLVYMALQSDSAGTVSLIFATDASRDGTPGDDPAVRITPENGDCNPQDMRRYGFAPDARPVFGPDQARAGVTAADLPAFMAVAATEAMLAEGLARTREETAPQNICTRKLWQRLVAPRTGQ